MLKKFLNGIHKGEKGITGLETAIILIAFVVVAAVFAYTVLSAGLFATQKSSEAVYSGLEEVQSTISLKGAVIAKAEVGHTGASGNISQLTFTIVNAIGGEPIDFTLPTSNVTSGKANPGSNNVLVISYIDQSQRIEDLFWTTSKMGNADADDLLEANEQFQVTIGNATHTVGGGNMFDALTTPLGTNTSFTIELKTPKGAVLVFERKTPAYIDSVMNLN